MELVSYQPSTIKSYWLPFQEARILPIGDIQYQPGEATDIGRLNKYISWGLEHKTRFLGMGDYVDVASPSNRKILSAVRGSLYDSVRKMMDEKVGQQVDELCDILKETRDTWDGLLTGHHTWEFEDGSTTESRLAQYLRTPMLGHCAALILRFKQAHHHVDAKIWAHHGAGGGQLTGAPLNRLENAAKYFMANVYLMAHQHKVAVSKLPWIDYDLGRGGKTIRMRGTTRYLVATGSFLRAYEHESRNARGLPEGGYVEQKMLMPTALGAAMVMLRPVYDEDGDRIDISVSV